MRRRVALVGTFDVDNYGDHLFPRIAERELSRRLPGVILDCYSPFGSLHPTRFTGGPSILALGPYADDVLDRFADRYDAMVVGGGELLHLNDRLLEAFYAVDAAEVAQVQPSRWFLEGVGAGREETCPIFWHAIGVPYDLDAGQSDRVRAVLASRSPAVVRDHRSRRRLADAGIAAVTVVPDSGLLVDRILDREDLARRRRSHGIPDGTMVVQGCDLLVPFVHDIAEAIDALADEHGLEITLVETGRCRGDGPFADALAVSLAGRPHRRLSAAAELEDVAAVLASASLFVGSSLHGAITSLVYGRPFVLVNLGDESKLRGFVELVGLEDQLVEQASRIPQAAKAAFASADDLVSLVADLQEQVDRHFDVLAGAMAERGKGRRWLAARRRS